MVTVTYLNCYFNTDWYNVSLVIRMYKSGSVGVIYFAPLQFSWCYLSTPHSTINKFTSIFALYVCNLLLTERNYRDNWVINFASESKSIILSNKPVFPMFDMYAHSTAWDWLRSWIGKGLKNSEERKLMKLRWQCRRDCLLILPTWMK